MDNGNMFFMHYLFLLLEILEHRSKSLSDDILISIDNKRSAKMNPLVGTSEEDKSIIQKGECKFSD